MKGITTNDLQQVIELLAIAITADMPVTMRGRIADRLQELGSLHRANSPTAGTYCINLAKLLQSLPPQSPANH